MVCKGRYQNAGNDWKGLFKPRGEYKCEQLGFVAHFSEGNTPGRDEESFHNRSKTGQLTNDHTASPANPEAL